MAAKDFYSGSNDPTRHPRSPSPYYGVYDATASSGISAISASSTPAPPYSASAAATHSSDRPPRHDTVSPFDTVFDDHVYPVDSRQNASSQASMAPSSRYGQDTRYYGQGPSSPEDRTRITEDIPLQNQPPKDGDFNDHVYDAAEQGRAPRSRRPKKVGFGQLGMFGADRKRIPWVVYLFSIIQLAVFIGEIARNAMLTGSPIMTQPFFNPMIGPSTNVMINMGARYVPCMHNVKGVQDKVFPPSVKITWPCPNSTSSDPDHPTRKCSLSELCGFWPVPEPLFNGDINQSPEPNQWFRFITPIFLHAGLIHIGFNLLLQLTIGKEMEMAIGSLRFFLVYMASGIFGNVMGANYAGTGEPSTGASGALFGIIALTLLDLLYSWKDRRSPVKDLLFIMLDIVISFVLGLLPGLDNFAHIGGFLMGLLLGVCVLHSPNSLRRRIGTTSTYASVPGVNDGPPSFFKSPVGFFKGRKPLWWAWWFVRVGALFLVVIVMVVLLNNFYTSRNTCDWCKYLSCLPINDWCETGNIKIELKTSQPTSRAALALF